MIEIFTKPGCGFCVKAKQWFAENGHEYVEYNVMDANSRADLEQRKQEQNLTLRTVPQIFINGKHVGGYTDLIAAKDTLF